MTISDSYAANGADGVSSERMGTDGAVATTLESLKETLATLVRSLKDSKLQAELASKLHDPNTLPDKEMGALAGQVVDLLDEAKQILQPDQLVLADHFMGLLISPKQTIRPSNSQVLMCFTSFQDTT